MQQQSASNFEKIGNNKIHTKGLKVEKDKGYKVTRRDDRKGKRFGRYDNETF